MTTMTPSLQRIDQGLVLDLGPISMLIRVLYNGAVDYQACQHAAEKVVEQYHKLIPELTLARSFDATMGQASSAVLKKMIQSTILLSDNSYTPMVSVAGAFADIAADAIVDKFKYDQILINNGGDMAILNRLDEPIKIGIVSDIDRRDIDAMLVLSRPGRYGVATSGFGGRSLTKGIVTALTAVAADSVTADAAATHLVNQSYVEHPNIERVLAEEIDAETDLQGHYIVRRVGKLDNETIMLALRNAMEATDLMVSKHIIYGSTAFLRGHNLTYPLQNDDFSVYQIRREIK